MAYCTITNVRALNPKRTYDASSTPTETQVGTFINQISDEIDVVLEGRGFTVPVTTPAKLLAYLLHVNALGAAALAEQAMFPETTRPGTSASGANLWKQYQDALAYLRTGELPRGSGGSGGAIDLPFSFAEKNQATETEPTETYDWQKPKFGKNKEF
jgi:hypothetical protein